MMLPPSKLKQKSAASSEAYEPGHQFWSPNFGHQTSSPNFGYRIRATSTSETLIRDHDRAIASGHQFSFFVADHKTNQIRSRFDVEAGFYGNAGTVQAIEGGVEELHFENFFSAS